MIIPSLAFIPIPQNPSHDCSQSISINTELEHAQLKYQDIYSAMNEIESCELSLTIKELKLSVKFPCKLTFQHSGKSLTSQIASNATNVFSVNKDITIKQEKPKDFIEININLATQKGGNIMAGIMKVNLKEINSSEGQIITLTLQKCLDPYASCTLYVKSVRMSKSRVKTMALMDDKKSKNIHDSRFQTKSEAPIMEVFKSRARYNQAQQFNSKKISFTSSPNYLKQKALSTVGFKVVKDTSFERDELASRFKHLNRKVEEEDSKTVITGRWRDTDQVLKSTMQSNEKALKLQIMKYKTKYEESQKNLQEKQKQIKNFKDQISDLNRQLTQKNYLLEEIGSKNNQISKLQELNKSLSKEFHEDRNRIIDLERQLQEQKNTFANQLTKIKEESERKEYDFQKQLYQKKEEMKQLSEESQYKVNQIKKMKVLIEDLERSLEMKGLQFEKLFSNEKNEHNRTKVAAQTKVSELNSRIQTLQSENEELKLVIKASQDQMQKIVSKLKHTQQSLKQCEENLEAEIEKKDKIVEEKKLVQKSEEELTSKVKLLQKELSLKEKQSSESINQLNEANAISKKKLLEFTQKNKAFATRIQQLQNKCNILSASEDKLKRNIEILQKDNKNNQQNEKVIIKNLKIKDDRILQLQRQLSDVQNKTSMKENLGKKDLEYKTAQIEKQNAKITDLQRLYEKEREENQAKRLQILKNQNKMKMLQEANHRLSEQITEIKQNYLKKEEELRSYISQQNEEIKALETKEIEYNKEIHNHEMDKINLKNEIARGEKSLENLQQKIEKSKKRETQLEQTLKNLSNELEARNEEIVELQSDYKILQNDFKLLQADKSKHEKITTIISEEKDNIKNDISKLKKEIEKRDQKQEQYLSQIKGLKEQITKVQLRLSTVTKESQKFKANISESVKSVMILKQNFLGQDNMSRSNVQMSRSLQRSRVLKTQSNDLALGLEDNKLGDFIETFSRESHQTISSLNEQLRKIKKQKESLEKQNTNLNNRLKDSQEELSKTIKDMSNEIESIVNRTNEDAQEYQEKISYLEKQLAKKEKSLGDLMNQIQEISNINENQKSNHEIGVSDLLSKIESLKFKIVDLQRKDENNAQVFINLQQKISELEQYNLELTHQVDLLSQQVQKKDRIINAKLQESEQLLEELQAVKRYKNDISIELLSLKESLTVQRESNQRLIHEIKSEQSKTTHLKSFQNEILKEKESFLKKDFEKSERIYALEEKVQSLMVEIAQKTEQLSTKTKSIQQQKDTIKLLQVESNNIQVASSDFKLNLEKEKERVKEKERKITEKDAQIQNLSGQIKKITLKYETQVKNLHQQNETITEKLNKERLEFSMKSQEYQSQIKSQKENQKRIVEYNTSLQEQIFFEKQTNSLNSSKIEELKQQISDLQIESNKLNNEISMLSEQIKEKEESLFALSGKLYSSDNRLESKEEEFKQRLEKVELDWRYKLQEICEEYQHKLQIIEREKNYVKHGMNDFNENIEKLQSAQITLKLQQQRQKQLWQLKIKRVQEEKLTALIEKNKQIQKLRELIDELEEKIKRKEFEYKLIQDEKRKTEEKNKELKLQVQRCEDKKNEALRSFEKQIDQFKRKEGQLKRFKQALKNSQWTTEREIKKNIQNVSKTLSNLTPQSSKGQILQTMKNLQSAVIKLALPNIDEL